MCRLFLFSDLLQKNSYFSGSKEYQFNGKHIDSMHVWCVCLSACKKYVRIHFSLSLNNIIHIFHRISPIYTWFFYYFYIGHVCKLLHKRFPWHTNSTEVKCKLYNWISTREFRYEINDLTGSNQIKCIKTNKTKEIDS